MEEFLVKDGEKKYSFPLHELKFSSSLEWKKNQDSSPLEEYNGEMGDFFSTSGKTTLSFEEKEYKLLSTGGK